MEIDRDEEDMGKILGLLPDTHFAPNSATPFLYTTGRMGFEGLVPGDLTGILEGTRSDFSCC